MDLEKETKEKELREREKRRNINNDIIRRLKAKEPLQEQSHLTWFPPRPRIKKDEKHVKELYGEKANILGESKFPKLMSIKNTEGATDEQGTDKPNNQGENGPREN